uniref:Uncharacterized protein n=1 Tax=viral metagenome TaxID=1070528 RepID=A0A6H1ZCR0_9ZZZZ
MPRITKAMLEERMDSLIRENIALRKTTDHFKEVNELLKQRQFDVTAFCTMHAEGTTALAHALTDLRVIIQKLH